MRKIAVIACKELYTTFRSRNLILLMFATPLVLSTIIGLAFGGDGGSDIPDFADIAVAVVNLDEGVDLQEELNLPDQFTNLDALPFDLNDVALPFGDSQVGLDALLQSGSALNFGDQIAGILLSQPPATASSPGSPQFDSAAIGCSLLDESGETGEANFAAPTALDDLLDATAVADAEQARAAVDSGEYAAAVIIPPQFSKHLMPRFVFDIGPIDLSLQIDTDNPPGQPLGDAGAIELYANNGRPISARIVHSIVAAIVNQFVRLNVALSATLETSANTLLNNLDLRNVDLSGVDIPSSIAALPNLDAAAIEPLGCLITPGASNITVSRQPLDALQQAPRFARVIVPIGAAQALFFALFTGVFGIQSIYEERRQWTLQRLLVSPTPRYYLLAGKLLGNLVIVFVQLLILLAAFTLIASVVIGQPTFIWGGNPAAIVSVTLALALCVTGLGVFVVGLARTPEQVQIFAPMINIALAVLGGAFGFTLPDQVAKLSMIYWGVEAFIKLANAQTDVAVNLLTLFAQGIALFLLGAWLFKRRMNL